MAHETVTKSQRFYCVSLTPDICKTPVGNSVVPIPYNIKGEFKTAQAVSKDVKTHSEPVFLHNKSFIPSVTGDERGTLGGIKSGTFLKRVESKDFSPTKGSNGTQTVQESRLVWMNDRNTIGRVMERQVQAPRARLKIFGWEAPTAEEVAQGWKDKSEAVHDAAGKAIEVGGKIEIASGVVAGAGVVVGATGVGLPAAAVMEAGAGVGAAVGGGVMGTGVVVDGAASVADAAADYVLTGKTPDAVATALEFGERVVLNRLPGGGWLKRFFKKKEIPGKAKPPKNEPKPKKGHDDDKSDGGKVKQEKPKKEDKPADCCPKNTAPGGKSAKTKKPAHIGTGEEILYQTDFALDGPTPLDWTRTYRSGSECEDWGVFGARWASLITTSLSISERGIVYHDATGRAVRLPVLASGEAHSSATEGFILRHEGVNSYSLTWHDGTIDTFGKPIPGMLPHGYEGINVMRAPRPPLATMRQRLQRRTYRDGSGIDIEWLDGVAPGQVMLRVATRDGLLVEAFRADFVSEEIELRVELSPRIGRIEQGLADGSRIVLARYRYATARLSGTHVNGPPASALPLRCELIEQSDVAGAGRAYSYEHLLLTRYVNYAGLAFHLEWISLDALRDRWAGNAAADENLSARHPIHADNSYRARVVRSLDADGSGDTRLEYLDADSTRLTEADGSVFLYSFNASWLVTEVVRLDHLGTAHSLGQRVWDGDGHLIAERDALGNETRYGYDNRGNLCEVTNAKGQTTHILFDDHNQMVGITDPLGHTSTRNYDRAGRVKEMRDPLGRVTSFTYDEAGYLRTVRDARGGINHLTYDAAGRLVEYVDCSQNSSKFNYDSKNRLTSSIDAAGNKTSGQYDVRDRLVQLVHPDGGEEKFSYDCAGNLVEHCDQQGRKTRYEYNGYGLPIKRTDALGQTLLYEYDRALRPIALLNQNGEAYRFGYDDDGNLASETGFDGKTTSYTYDRAGHLSKRLAASVQTEYARDALGNLQAIVNADGAVRYAYDAVGRLVAVSSSHADLRFAYDGAGQLIDERVRYRTSPTTAMGEQTSPVFTLNHAYDELGNRIQTTLPNGRRVDTLRYGSGHWHGTLWHGRSVADIEHDRLHRETRRQLGRGPARLIEERTYDPESRLQSIVVRVGALRLLGRTYDYDPSGTIAGYNDDRHGRTSYTYDPVGQLLAATQLGLRETFSFDPAGNLLDGALYSDRSTSGSPTSLSDLVDQPAIDDERPILPKVTHNLLQRFLGVSYTYDVHGNVVTRLEEERITHNEAGVLVMEYDAENQLVLAIRSFPQYKLVSRYLYDPFGRRIAKQVYKAPFDSDGLDVGPASPGTTVSTTFFVWDGDVLAQEVDSNAVITYLYEPESFVPLARVCSAIRPGISRPSSDGIASVFEWAMPVPKDDPCEHVKAWQGHMEALREAVHCADRELLIGAADSETEDDVIHYYLCDHLGTPFELVDDSGRAVWSVRYRAWGSVFAKIASDIDQPLRMQGQYEDRETGLHYNRFRYYDPHVGRFLTQDPIRLAGGENLYQYGPNPTWWIDPMGLAAGGGGAYMFETLHNKAYVGKGPYQRYKNSTKQRTTGKQNGVDRGVHMDTQSPCKKYVSEAQYAEMVEHKAMEAYASYSGAKPLLNSASSPGKKRLDPKSDKGKKNLKNCPGIDAAAEADGNQLLQLLLAKPPGTGL